MKSAPKLIALYSSAPGSGKSEVASVLHREMFQVRKFATPLKAMVDELLVAVGYQDTYEFLEGSLKETPIEHPAFGGATPRKLMQTLGTEWGRNTIFKDIWTTILFLEVLKLQSKGLSVVVDDMRFPNEWDTMKALGAQTVWIKRPGLVARTTHPSEGLLDGHQFDLEIVNDGDVEALHAKAYRELVTL